MIQQYQQQANQWVLTPKQLNLINLKRRKQENEHIPRKKQLQINDDVVGEESWMPSAEIIIPVTINLVVLLGFQTVGMGLFSTWEDWDLVSSAYFCFITMTTIG